MKRNFYNPLNLPNSIILKRLTALDLDATSVTNEPISGELQQTLYSVAIESSLTDVQIENCLASPIAVDEQAQIDDFISTRATLKSQYQTTVDRLIQIENAAAPTNAQVIQAIRDMAKFERWILKLLARIFFG
jgi:hypothetical protein